MSPSSRIAGIVLAAGESSRMGRHKLLLPFNGSTIVETVVTAGLDSRLDHVVVVLGHRFDETAALIGKRNVTIVRNDAYKDGQSTSMRAGIDALDNDVDGALFLLADQPLVTAGIINSIIDAFSASAAAVVPVCSGRRGNPVLWSRDAFPALRALSGDMGGRVLFERYAGRITFLPVNDAAVIADIDTADEYHRAVSGNTGATEKETA